MNETNKIDNNNIDQEFNGMGYADDYEWYRDSQQEREEQVNA